MLMSPFWGIAYCVGKDTISHLLHIVIVIVMVMEWLMFGMLVLLAVIAFFIIIVFEFKRLNISPEQQLGDTSSTKDVQQKK